MAATAPLSILNLIAAFGLILVVVWLSKVLNLKVERKVLVASFRAALQLTFLGYCLLVPIFSAGSPIFVLGYLFFVLLVAAREASSRASFTYGDSLFIHCFAAIGGACSLILTYTVVFIIMPTPWWEPQYIIPIAGMVVGNSISSFSLALDRFLSGIKQRAPEIEFLLSMGASTYEACLPIAREACVAGLTPNLNQMSVVGLVSIPGMMTGQILGGQSPGDASRYQLMILFVICATSLSTIIIGLCLAVFTLFDDQHRLCCHACQPTPGYESVYTWKKYFGFQGHSGLHEVKNKKQDFVMSLLTRLLDWMNDISLWLEQQGGAAGGRRAGYTNLDQQQQQPSKREHNSKPSLTPSSALRSPIGSHSLSSAFNQEVPTNASSPARTSITHTEKHLQATSSSSSLSDNLLATNKAKKRGSKKESQKVSFHTGGGRGEEEGGNESNNLQGVLTPERRKPEVKKVNVDPQVTKKGNKDKDTSESTVASKDDSSPSFSSKSALETDIVGKSDTESNVSFSSSSSPFAAVTSPVVISSDMLPDESPNLAKNQSLDFEMIDFMDDDQVLDGGDIAADLKGIDQAPKEDVYELNPSPHASHSSYVSSDSLDVDSDIDNYSKNCWSLIVNNLNVSVQDFDTNEKRVLIENLNLNVLPGEIICIIGKSGIGKSKILRAIASLDSCDLSHQHNHHRNSHSGNIKSVRESERIKKLSEALVFSDEDSDGSLNDSEPSLSFDNKHTSPIGNTAAKIAASMSGRSSRSKQYTPVKKEEDGEQEETSFSHNKFPNFADSDNEEEEVRTVIMLQHTEHDSLQISFPLYRTFGTLIDWSKVRNNEVFNSCLKNAAQLSSGLRQRLARGVGGGGDVTDSSDEENIDISIESQLGGGGGGGVRNMQEGVQSSIGGGGGFEDHIDSESSSFFNFNNSVPFWRSKVCYLPQDLPSGLLGSPMEFYNSVNGFNSRKGGFGDDNEGKGNEASGSSLPVSASDDNLPASDVEVGAMMPNTFQNSSGYHSPSASNSVSNGGSSHQQPSALPTPYGNQPIDELEYHMQEMDLPGQYLLHPWSSLSGGERQRMALAILLSLSPKPAVLLLDEPTSALDMETTIAVEACLDRCCRNHGMSVLWVTHSEDQAKRVSSRILHVHS